MMSPAEQREFVEDGRSSARRTAFRRAESLAALSAPAIPALDGYLALLSGYQALFGPVPVSHERITGRLFRL